MGKRATKLEQLFDKLLDFQPIPWLNDDKVCTFKAGKMRGRYKYHSNEAPACGWHTTNIKYKRHKVLYINRGRVRKYDNEYSDQLDAYIIALGVEVERRIVLCNNKKKRQALLNKLF